MFNLSSHTLLITQNPATHSQNTHFLWRIIILENYNTRFKACSNILNFVKYIFHMYDLGWARILILSYFTYIMNTSGNALPRSVRWEEGADSSLVIVWVCGTFVMILIKLRGCPEMGHTINIRYKIMKSLFPARSPTLLLWISSLILNKYILRV